jgi:exodeoxyribonuclease V gamma subunit
LERLAELVELFDAGLCEPLPIACKTSAAFAHALRSGGDAVKAATREWKTEWSFPREDEEPEHELVFGECLTFEQLLSETAFDAYARRLWDPVLEWEQAEHR